MRERTATLIRRTLLGTGFLSTALLLTACHPTLPVAGPALQREPVASAAEEVVAPRPLPASGAPAPVRPVSAEVLLAAPSPGAWSDWLPLKAVSDLEVRVQRDPVHEGWFRTQFRNQGARELHVSYAASVAPMRAGEAELRESLPAGQTGPAVAHALLPVPARIHLLVEDVRRGPDDGPFERLASQP